MSEFTRTEAFYQEPDDWEKRADEFLIAEPAFTVEELEALGTDAGIIDLIRLERPDGTLQLPKFQFNEDGAPHEIVLKVNKEMLAAEDPWGVTSWWIVEDSYMKIAPKTLIENEPAHYALFLIIEEMRRW